MAILRASSTPSRFGSAGFLTTTTVMNRLLIVIFPKITDATLRVMIVSFNRCEGTKKGAVLCQDCSKGKRPVHAAGGPVLFSTVASRCAALSIKRKNDVIAIEHGRQMFNRHQSLAVRFAA
jgi:hypothetical protein